MSRPAEHVQHVLGRLDRVRRSGEGWTARCPAHEDRNPSLSVNEGRDGRVLLHCFAGCSAEAIASALGLEPDALAPARDERPRRSPRRARLVFVDHGPITADTRELLARQPTKRFAASTWAAFGVREGLVHFDSNPNRTERALAFPLPGGGYHLHLYARTDRRQRWRFSAGASPALLTAGLDRTGPVLLAEGEWDAMAAYEAGFAVATGTGGAGTFRESWARSLTDRDVVVIYDVDVAGRQGAHRAAGTLRKAGIRTSILDLPFEGGEAGKDLSDYLLDHNAEQLRTLVSEAIETATAAADTPVSASPPTGSPSQATRLVELVKREYCELQRDTLDQCWARIRVDEHFELWRLGSRGFRQWLARLFWLREGKAPSSDTVASALGVIEAEARFGSNVVELRNRVASHDGAIWLDLVDSKWRAVRVDGDGWRIVDEPPVLFRRHNHQLPQVDPQPGGDLRRLLELVNIPDPQQQLLLLVYIVSCLVPDIPHALPVLHGGQGAAKSTLFRIIRRLVDPSVLEVLSFPKDQTELVQQLSHHWLAFYDNLTSLPLWASDTLCRASTGEGFSKRSLYTDDEDVIYTFRRCPGLNGINVVATRADLLDRSLLFGLETIPKARRLSEKAFWSRFDRLRPSLVGAMLDALSRAIRLRPSVRPETLPRMADFALWGCAISEALGFGQRTFLAAYADNFAERNDQVVQSDCVATAVVAFMEQHRSPWSGSASELLERLEQVAQELHIDRRSRSWPKAPNSLSRRLNELGASLAEQGIVVDRSHSGERRLSLWLGEPEGSSPPDLDDTYERNHGTVQVSTGSKSLSGKAVDDMDGMDDISGNSLYLSSPSPPVPASGPSDFPKGRSNIVHIVQTVQPTEGQPLTVDDIADDTRTIPYTVRPDGDREVYDL